MTVGVVDIGTNTMRLLVTGESGEIGRWVEVTGLGRGVDRNGTLGETEMARTLECLARFGDLMDRHETGRRAAIATSAARDAGNREEFLERAERALGVRPEVISGEREGALAYAGATAELDPGNGWVVSDIGGGSTEFVTADTTVSIDIGSVRLTDRILLSRPAPSEQMGAAFAHVTELFSGVEVSGRLVGVAGTWTSIAAIDLGLDRYDRERVHHHRMTRDDVEGVARSLAGLSVEETAAIPSLDPGRAPVILAGAVVAAAVMEAVGEDVVLVSEHDTLDGLAMELMAVP